MEKKDTKGNTEEGEDNGCFLPKCVLKAPARTRNHLDTRSSSSYFSSSNFTMSCSGTDDHDIEPSTSGCSSYRPHTQTEEYKAKKKERVKEYLKELKSMIQPKGGRMGTLSTLQHVLSRMRKIKEVKKSTGGEEPPKDSDNEQNTEMPVVDLGHTSYESDSQMSLTSESLKSNDELRIVISTRDHLVRAVSGNLKYVLGYPVDSWVGRAFDEYMHKKDLITFNSVHGGSKIQDSEDEDMEETDKEKETIESKVFYFRLRKFKSLGNSGFSLRKQDSYIPFQCMFTQKIMSAKEVKSQGAYSSWYDGTSPSDNTGSPETGSPETGSPEMDHSELPSSPEERKLCTIMYCVPLISPYSRSGVLPEIKTFETRHTLFCSYCNIQPNTIPLLGYLPQEMVGVSIFDFYHNDDLGVLYNIYKQVIALKGVPYRSGPIRIRAKNGAWVTTKTEWSSFVNPWTKRLEFIIGKHTVVKGPKNTDVFSESYTWPTSEDLPEHIREGQQKIKDLLLQPVETVYVGSPTKAVESGKKEKSVAILDVSVHGTEDQLIPSTQKVTIESSTDQSKHYQSDLEKKNVGHNTGLLFKENSISRAYEQLNYTNGIKKFLLSQPRTYLSDSEEGVKKISSDDCEYSDSIPEVPSDTDFDFEISVPKPPSFGSSTKVLVSEQEHREDSFYANNITNENLLDPMSIREHSQQMPPPQLLNTSQQVENPISKPPENPVVSVTQDCPVVSLTRESLWKHTLLQEQLYLATASPDRNILFTNKSGEFVLERPEGQRSRKRSHSPDRVSTERCQSLFKAGRTTESRQDVASSVGVLNPMFPIAKQYEGTVTSNPIQRQILPSRYGAPLCSPEARAPISMQMYPVMSMNPMSVNTPCETSTESSMSLSSHQHPRTSLGNVQWPYYPISGVCSSMCTQSPSPPHPIPILNPSRAPDKSMSLNPQVMVGFHQPTILQPMMPQIGVPIPVQQLNSYIMQQAKMGPPKANVPTQRIMSARMMANQKKNIQSSSEESSTDDTRTSLYMLESGSDCNVKSDYNQLMLALNMFNTQGLKPAPWLENVCLTPHIQLKYHMPRTKRQRQLKKDREASSELVQPELVMDQLDQLLEDIDQNDFPFLNEETDHDLSPDKSDNLDEKCSCLTMNNYNNWSSHDHGISRAVHMKQKSSKKERRGSKPKEKTPPASVELPEFKMEVDNDESLPVSNCADPGKWEQSKSSSSLKTISSDNSSLKNELMEDAEDAEVSDSVHSSNGSEMTPSDQRSNNENGSSMKESDGDAMSKRSDSSSDKQQSNSESETETKYDKTLDKLFVSLNLCFSRCHPKEGSWLADAVFNDKVQLQYSLKTKDLNKTLHEDLIKMDDFMPPDLIHAQLKATFEDIQVSSDRDGSAASGETAESTQKLGDVVSEDICMKEELDCFEMVVKCMLGECKAASIMSGAEKIDNMIFESMFGDF